MGPEALIQHAREAIVELAILHALRKPARAWPPLRSPASWPPNAPLAENAHSTLPSAMAILPAALQSPDPA